MELIKYTSEWVRGEVFQGKIMLLIGAILLIGGIAILRSEHEILRGALIPLGVVILIFLGYGGFQTFGRTAHLKKVESIYAQNRQEALTTEYEKATKDATSYKTLKIIWTILIIASAIMYLLMSGEYYKGLAIGIIGLFLTTLIVDSILHYRLDVYLKNLTELMSHG